MTSHENTLLKSFVLFILLLLLGIAITVYTQSKTLAPAKAASVSTHPAVLVPPKPVAAKVQETTVDSAKADQKLVLRSVPRQNGTTTYSFLITNFDGGSPRTLLTKTLGPRATMSLPWNSWDPTDTYIFVGEKEGSVQNYYVLRADGSSFASGDKLIDVGSIWRSRNLGLTIREATGWASGTLLIIYTSKDDGSKGPPYWFEIPSTATIQLAG